jgi:hypothetical protein
LFGSSLFVCSIPEKVQNKPYPSTKTDIPQKKKKTSRVGDLEMYISTLVGKPNTKAVVKFLLA